MNTKYLLPVAVLAISLSAQSLQASSGSWLGGTSALWNTDSNWTAANPNGTSQTATFNSASYSFQPSLNVTRSIASMTFGASNGGITLSPVGAFGLTLNASPGINVLAGSGANTIAVPITLAIGQTWRNSSSNLLTISGPVTNGGNLLVVDGTTNNNSILFSGAISGSGGLTMVNGGDVTLSTDNTYTNTTAVNAGTLLINGSTTGSAINVASGATVGGSGTITPGASHALAVSSGGKISVGATATPAVLTVNLSNAGDSASFASGSTFSFDLAAPGTSDHMAFTGLTLNIADVSFNSNTVNFTNVGGLAAGLYTLFTFDQANAFSGSLVIGTGLGSFAGSSFVYNANSIQLNVVPEPSTWILLFFAGTLTIVLRRRSADRA